MFLNLICFARSVFPSCDTPQVKGEARKVLPLFIFARFAF